MVALVSKAGQAAERVHQALGQSGEQWAVQLVDLLSDAGLTQGVSVGTLVDFAAARAH
ncbi:hypothetical protein [Streptomyces avermitilis]|uniref:hypothetical protein n=1 Tax=Streptomyces avermitilis TaxID=33903 RepID=UPI0033A0631F